MIVAMAGPVVVLEQVTKAYRRGAGWQRAVDCVDLAVMPASLVAIAGPS
jgi:ABC-type lipoprotein export system ATPase subunit